MGTRITQHQINARVELINAALGFTPGAVGSLAVDHYSPPGNPYGYRLVVLLTHGAQHDVTHERMTLREFYSYLGGMLDALDFAKGKI